jgi:hypothetical protein
MALGLFALVLLLFASESVLRADTILGTTSGNGTIDTVQPNSNTTLSALIGIGPTGEPCFNVGACRQIALIQGIGPSAAGTILQSILPTRTSPPSFPYSLTAYSSTSIRASSQAHPTARPRAERLNFQKPSSELRRADHFFDSSSSHRCDNPAGFCYFRGNSIPPRLHNNRFRRAGTSNSVYLGNWSRRLDRAAAKVAPESEVTPSLCMGLGWGRQGNCETNPRPH